MHLRGLGFTAACRHRRALRPGRLVRSTRSKTMPWVAQSSHWRCHSQRGGGDRSSRMTVALLLLLLLLLLHPAASAATTASSSRGQQEERPGLALDRPWVIAHRGASGHLPEHTLAAYQLAIDQGADFVECDVLLTRDLAPICRHDPDLTATTDAAALFPGRVNTYTIDGVQHTGVFAADLTLAEVRRLRAKQRWEFRGTHDDLRHGVPTLAEFLDLVAAAPRVVGVYPEAKHPTWHASLPWVAAANTSVQDVVLMTLAQRGYRGPFGSPAWLSAPAFIQSFEETSLQQLVTDIPLVLLLGGWEGFVAPDTGLTHEQMVSIEHLQRVAAYATGVGPWKNTLYTSSAASAPTSAGAEAAAAGDHPDRPQPGAAADGSSASSGGGGSTCSFAGSGAATDSSELDAPAPPSVQHPVCQQQQRQRQEQQQQHLDDDDDDDDGGGGGGGGAARAQTPSAAPPGPLRSTGLTARLKAAGLQVHPYTLRPEAMFLPAGLTAPAGAAAEMQQLFVHEGVDGAFTDFPGALHDWLMQLPPPPPQQQSID